MREEKICPCHSGDKFHECCGTAFAILKIEPRGHDDTILTKWINLYSPPMIQMFSKKMIIYEFQLSCYLDWIIDEFFPLDMKSEKDSQANEIFNAIENNILLSILAAHSCVSQGLYMQSGVILRSLVEDSFVLLDVCIDDTQLHKLMNGKYSTTGLATRVKRYLPSELIRWYGVLSSSFTHMGPLHKKIYFPTGCLADNGILINSFYGVISGIVAFHTILERIHYDDVSTHYFWRKNDSASDLVFCDENAIYDWAQLFKDEVVIKLKTDELDLRPDQYKM